MKDCNAKKMVQPTDQDPNMFEVTYVGQHTCSSTSQPRSRSRKLKTPETSKTKFETGPVEEAALLSPDHFPSPSPENVKLDSSTLGNDELASHQLQATVTISCDKSWTDRLRETLGESATRSTSDEQSQEEEEGEEDEEEEEEDEEDQEEEDEGRRRPSVTSNLTCHDSDAVEHSSFNLSNSMANMAIPPRPSSTSEELHYQGHDDLMQEGGRGDDAEILLVRESSQHHYGFHQDHILWSSLMESPLPSADPKP